MMPETALRHRVCAAQPGKPSRAFTEPAARGQSFPPFGLTCAAQETDVREADALLHAHPNLVIYFEGGTSRPAFKAAMAAHLADCAVRNKVPV